jgi:cell division protein FtsQ
MARKSGSTISQDELYPSTSAPSREELDDARLLDLDVEEESPFLRGQNRVPARRGTIPKRTAARLIWGAIALTLAFFCAMAAASLYHYGEHSWRFRVESSDDLQISGLENVPRSQVMEVMGGDIGRNIFFIPLAERKKQLEQIPWVESASVMRFVPNQLRVEIHERVPVAFARVGSKILLIDAGGTLMDLPGAGKKKYSFPVILGTNPGEPLSTRAARMKIYRDLVSQLDSGGARYSQDLSEVDLSDPDDAKVLTNDTQGEVLVHLGSSNYLDRYKVYVSHVQQWRQQFDKLESVDLRYERQIVVNPDSNNTVRHAPLALSAAKAAMAAGVKPAALITHQRLGARPPATVTPATVSIRTLGPAPARKPVKVAHRKPSIGPAKAKAIAPKPKPVTKPAMQSRTTVQHRSKPAAPSQPVNTAAKKKPSPAIAKGPDQP